LNTVPVSPTVLAHSVLRINLRALQNNWRTLRSRGGSAQCGAVVKANAYGLGVEKIAPALYQAGCRSFFVAHLNEGILLRGVLKTLDAKIYILNGLSPTQAAAYYKAHLIPVLNSLWEVEEWAAFCADFPHRKAPPAAFHVDTGMSRLGLRAEELATFLQIVRQKSLNICVVMSHFACADQPNHPLNAQQIQAFSQVSAQIKSVFPDVEASLCNSSGVFLPQNAHFDLTRAGYALYGGNPTPNMQNPMQEVVMLQSPILQVRTVKKGESVGYSALWVAQKESQIAAVALGYADGYLRGSTCTDAASPAAYAKIAGYTCPLLGRISMDLIALDVSDLPPNVVQRGQEVTFLGEGISLEQVASTANTIGYEILTRLGGRFQLIYTDA
jgi:alanine racemase